MRLDARDPAFQSPWHCWDAEKCCEVLRVVWADDVSHEYGVYTVPFTYDGYGSAVTVPVKVREIRILPERRLVLINPVCDAEKRKESLEVACT